MPSNDIDYHVTDIGGVWGIFRGESQIGMRRCPHEAVAFANFFADWESLSTNGQVRVVGDCYLDRTLRGYRPAA
ncbi:hypothetical protein EC912_10837 [Luteibacter rhizovicinus]|uniref:Uncharacterized protein n=1 Tax=Luteibacter rhizovicinus TaxID=242606 RepID=A0A4R3YIK8_9GAMM|nr:hypothetical protein [Luteibacter rhizovicinus]TCV92046.1 hypothetical protein EC912_10837 [Luteibacter rhizovicinus]